MPIDLGFLNTFIRGDALILIPVLYVLYLLFKRTPHVPDWGIPWILLVVASISCFLYYGLIIQAFVQAVLVTGAATLSNELIGNTVQAYKDNKQPPEE